MHFSVKNNNFLLKCWILYGEFETLVEEKMTTVINNSNTKAKARIREACQATFPQILAARLCPYGVLMYNPLPLIGLRSILLSLCLLWFWIPFRIPGNQIRLNIKQLTLNATISSSKI